jgi:hypothetical protein
MPSKRANRYGTLAEKHIADTRSLVRKGEHTSWCDARYNNGVPVEIKSCNASTGYFQIYKKYHRKIRQEGGWYAFVVYKPQGRGITVLRDKMIQADKLPLRAMWSPTGGHRNSEKAKVPISRIFQ